jgi:4-azaleucine resistance transporter AzlC
MEENRNKRMGLRDGLPIGLGYLSVSFAFGIFGASSGLSVLECFMISLFNLTSAGQLAAVPIIVTGGGLIELALTQLVINLRYSLMSVSLSQKLGKSVRLGDRFLISFANTDEIFAVASSKPGTVGREYMYSLALYPILGWTLGTLLGALAGNILPEVIVNALGIAIYAMFIAIVVPAARCDGKVALCVLTSAVLSLIFYYLPPLSEIPSGFSIIITATLASLAFALLAPIEPQGEVSENV